MTDQLFQKALVFADLHYGRAGNAPDANQDNRDFLEWAIARGRSWGADTVLMLGDWHDNRHAIGVATMQHSLAGLKALDAAFDRILFLPGNHDLLYRERRDVASIEFAELLPHISIVREPLTIDNVTLLPWLVGDEPTGIRDVPSRYAFGHLALPNFKMNDRVPMPSPAGPTIAAAALARPEWVFSGHFHMRQTRNNICYIGNVMPFHFGDADDTERGIMLLAWGGQPRFEAWPDQPTYRRLALSELISESGMRQTRPRQTLRVCLDQPLDHGMGQELRDMLITRHGVRKLEFIPQADQAPVAETAAKSLHYESVDQIVLDGLAQVDELGDLSRQRLIALYRTLCDG